MPRKDLPKAKVVITLQLSVDGDFLTWYVDSPIEVKNEIYEALLAGHVLRLGENVVAILEVKQI